MSYMSSRSRLKFFEVSILSIVIFFICFPAISFALTPIARWDVVPYQRVEIGQNFNVGVIAFSKDGINRVEFTVSGQGYSGPNPMQSSSMTYNSRTDVYEYWVPVNGNDFSSNGAFTMQATVYGTDGGTRNLPSLPLVVNATGSLSQPKAWVSNSGNNSTGAVNNSSKPFLTVGGAVSAIQAANGGKSDGGIVYLFQGTYNLGDGSVSTSNEWITITRDPSAAKENTIINASGSIRNTTLLKVDGITLQSRGSSQYVFTAGSPTNLWMNNSRIIGSGRWVVNTNPIHFSSDTGHYSTNNYIYNADYAYRRATLVRGVDMVAIGNDAFENTAFVVNCTLDDLSNGPNPAWHADAYQVFTGSTAPPADNRIIYNYKATNVRYEGVFMRSDAGQATDNAFVNVLIEAREPADKNETNKYAFMSVSVNQSWDHLLFWNCTFLNAHGEFYGTYTNSSFIGNIFYQYVDNRTDIGDPTVPYAVPGNSANNDIMYNHFLYVYELTGSCVPNSRFADQSWPCPHWRAKKPDSHPSGSSSMGDGVLNLDDPMSASFGAPIEGSPLLDRIPFVTVPADIYGNPRSGNIDIGAIEGSSTSPPASLATPSGFKKL